MTAHPCPDAGPLQNAAAFLGHPVSADKMEAVRLCPFCDGTHRRIGFTAQQ